MLCFNYCSNIVLWLIETLAQSVQKLLSPFRNQNFKPIDKLALLLEHIGLKQTDDLLRHFEWDQKRDSLLGRTQDGPVPYLKFLLIPENVSQISAPLWCKYEVEFPCSNNYKKRNKAVIITLVQRTLHSTLTTKKCYHPKEGTNPALLII